MRSHQIMIVEDEEIVVADVRASVEKMGYGICATAASGEEAIRMAGSGRPDLVLMDIVLKGGMDGIAAATRIKELYGIPVVYLTAFGDDELLQRAKVSEPSGYIMKPYRDRELQIAIEIAIYKKRAEERIAKVERWLATVLKSIGDAVIASDQERRVTFMNSVAESLTGWKHDDALGRKITEILNIKDQDAHDLESHIAEKVITEGLIINLLEDRLLVAKDGKEIPISDSVAPIKGENNSNPGFVLIFRDITERMRVEERLREALASLRKALNATIQVLVSAVESRDPYTAGHQARSADLARAIAREMGLPQDRIDGIRMAGSIHDIGKLSVPAEILSKPSKLSDIEFSLIREHACKGYKMLKDVASPWPLAEIVYQHHERLDGSGYPRGLKGEEIIIEARILAVADVVESMASNRPYRPALGLEEALAEIERHQGKLYDADVVAACLNLFKAKGYRMPNA